MRRGIFTLGFLASVWLVGQTAAWAGQAPGAASDADIPMSHRDRLYAPEQFSNTVSVTDPFDDKLLGVVRPLATPASMTSLAGLLLVFNYAINLVLDNFDCGGSA